MISHAFENIMKKTFCESLKVGVSDALPSAEALSCRENISAEKIKAEHAVVLTISSHLFRIIMVIYYEKNEVFNRYLKACLGETTKLDEARIKDYVFEVGNLFCGTIKRDLQKVAPSLGMSTPNLLKTEALQHINTLKLDMDSHLELKYEGKTLLFASYFISAYGDVDVIEVTDTSDTEEVDAGELEFF